jgi:hypothetical protein
LDVEVDPAASRQYIEMAVAQGHPGATYYIALMHRNGEGGLESSQTRFRHFLNMACELGHGEALNCMADMYYKGEDGVQADHRKALSYYERAGRAGDVSALCSAAAMHFHGFGTKSDHHKALLLYQDAAVLGSPRALQSLGSMYFHGHGVPKNISIAEHFFRMVEESHRKGEHNTDSASSDEVVRWMNAPPRSSPHTAAEADALKAPKPRD